MIRSRWRFLSPLAAGALGLCLFAVDNTTHEGTSHATGPQRLVHPGILVTQPQLDFVKAKIAAGTEPWTSAFARAKADPHGARDYTPHPPHASAATQFAPSTDEGIVLCGSFSDPDVHCTHEKDDGVAAYTQALLWYFTGDETYGRNAIAILDGWSILKDHGFFNAALQAAWMGTQFARAAEIMQLDSNWPKANVAAFKSMMENAFLPRLRAALPGTATKGDASYGQNGNWLLSIADTLIQIGVLLDNLNVFNQGVQLWRDRMPAYCYFAPVDGAHPSVPCSGYNGSNTGFATPATRTGDPYGYWGQAGGTAAAPRTLVDGLSQETCRDLEHVQYGLAAIVNAAETARIQGVDLYGEQAERMVACMEFAAGFENQAPKNAAGQIPSYTIPIATPVTVTPTDATLCPTVDGKATVSLLATGSLGTYVVQPTWEIGYNEFANRLNLPMPKTRALIDTYRAPPAGWVGVTHHMGWETLTHAEVGSVGLSPTACGP